MIKLELEDVEKLLDIAFKTNDDVVYHTIVDIYTEVTDLVKESGIDYYDEYGPTPELYKKAVVHFWNILINSSKWDEKWYNQIIETNIGEQNDK